MGLRENNKDWTDETHTFTIQHRGKEYTFVYKPTTPSRQLELIDLFGTEGFDANIFEVCNLVETPFDGWKDASDKERHRFFKEDLPTHTMQKVLRRIEIIEGRNEDGGIKKPQKHSQKKSSSTKNQSSTKEKGSS